MSLKTSFEFQSFDLFLLRKAYLDRVISVSDVVYEVLERIEKFKQYNIWISLEDTEKLLEAAKNLEKRDPQNLPLYGIPFAVKDNIDVAGFSTTAACPGFSYTPRQTAFAVQPLLEAGALLIGKTNMDQFATGLTGTRSPEPFGICKNSLNPVYISGGSSSGSAVAVALNIVSFSLGTDTAGSGRVPAAFNNIFGLKPTRGLISCTGIVPACQSLDCVSVFSHTAAEADFLLEILNRTDPSDIYGRTDRQLMPPVQYREGQPNLRFGVPKPEQLNFFGDDEGFGMFKKTITALRSFGDIVEIDFQPFLEAAGLLYDGPWIAERYAGVRNFIDAHPDRLHPVILQVLSAAHEKNAIEAFIALNRLQQLKHQTLSVLRGLSCIAVPTAPRLYRIDEVLDDPVRLNSNLGYYTNFMNLLDLCAVALPSGFYSNGLPFGITLFAESLFDRRLLDIAQRIQNGSRRVQSEDGTGKCYPMKAPETMSHMRIAVCGAHMHGLPLNRQLIDLGAHFYATARTSANYRLYALESSPPERPGLLRDEAQGRCIDLEIWELPRQNWADFISKIKSPLCIGSVELEDGRWEYGFLCETFPVEKSVEITGFGGWRNYLSQRQI